MTQKSDSLTADGLRLIKAYFALTDPADRRRVINLAEKLVNEQSCATPEDVARH